MNRVMKEHFYTISTSMNTVTATIYYWEYSDFYKEGKSKRNCCSKSFSGGFWQFFKFYPKEEQLVEAKQWAITQCKIMNVNQPEN